jgi:hypothetical protein
MLGPDKDELPGRPPMPAMLHNQIDGLRRIAFELGGGRAIENSRREIEATRLAIARVEALARRVPPTAGESSPESTYAA